MSNVENIKDADAPTVTLVMRDGILADHIEPFYQRSKLEGETLEGFIVRAITSQAINAAAQHDCSELREAMEKELNLKATARMDEANKTAKHLFDGKT